MEDPHPQSQSQSLPASDSRHIPVTAGTLSCLSLRHLTLPCPSTPTMVPSFSADFKSFLNSFHTPNHRPYALMRQRAVRDLNEATGSSKEAISEFIRREYKDLPLAHMTVLGLHLRKLHDAGELLCTERVDNGNLGAVGDINKALEGSEDVERENGLPGQENEKQTGV